jgi:hypothetical protein
MIARIFVFMWIPHQIRCGIHTIMVRAPVRAGVGAGQRCRVPDMPDKSDGGHVVGERVKHECLVQYVVERGLDL